MENLFEIAVLRTPSLIGVQSQTSLSKFVISDATRHEVEHAVSLLIPPLAARAPKILDRWGKIVVVDSPCAHWRTETHRINCIT
jgi:hypothetical protein